MGESFLCRFDPVVCWFLIGDAEFCSEPEEVLVVLGMDALFVRSWKASFVGRRW